MEDIIDIIVTETTNLIEITSQPTDEVIDVNIIDNREDITLNVTPSVVEININQLTGNFGILWGEITGTLSSQTDLQNALNLKADLVDGKVPSSQLPSYVDDVVEVANYASLPATGEVGKIYITLDTNFIYRWTGSTYVEIKDSSAVWGAITGTLSNQTDLQNTLNAKEPTIAAGTTLQYWRGDKSWQTLNTTIVPEGTNLYYTDTRARAALSASSPLAYNSGTGVFSIPAATSSQNGYLTSTDWTTFNNKLSTATAASTYVPYTGATGNVNLGNNDITAGSFTGGTASFATSGAGAAVGINHSSGAGIALNISKSGSGEGIYVNKTSGTGNAVTIIGTLNATTIVKNGGTSSQYLMADGSVSTLTNPITGTGTSGIVAKFNGTSSVTDSIIYDNGTRVSIGADVTTSNKFTAVASTTSSYAVVAQASGAANGFWATLSGTGEIFRGQTSGGSYFIINNGGNAFLNGNLNVGDFASTSYRLNVVGTGNFTGALSGTSATFTGSLGVGNASPAKKLDVYDSNANATAQIKLRNSGTTSAAYLGAFSGNAYLSAGGTFDSGWTTDGTNGISAIVLETTNGGSSINLQTAASNISPTTRMTITSAGNVGIGTTAPTSLFHIASTTTLRSRLYTSSGASFMDIENAGNSFYVGVDDSSGSTFGGSAYARTFYGTGAYPMVFWTNATERMRITSGGALLVGTTSTSGIATGSSTNKGMNIDGFNGTLSVQRNDDGCIYLSKASGYSSGNLMSFYVAGSAVGTISTNGTTTSYNITSDYRLKEDLKSIKGLEIINKIKVYDYKWKASDSRMDGVLAHELAEILPYAVTGVKDGEQIQSVDYSKIVPVMVQAIKEEDAKIIALQNKVVELETEIQILKNK